MMNEFFQKNDQDKRKKTNYFIHALSLMTLSKSVQIFIPCSIENEIRLIWVSGSAEKQAVPGNGSSPTKDFNSVARK